MYGYKHNVNIAYGIQLTPAKKKTWLNELD